MRYFHTFAQTCISNACNQECHNALLENAYLLPCLANFMSELLLRANQNKFQLQIYIKQKESARYLSQVAAKTKVNKK